MKEKERERLKDPYGFDLCSIKIRKSDSYGL